MAILEAGGGAGGVGVVFIPSLAGAMRSLLAFSVQAVCRKLGVPFLRYSKPIVFSFTHVSVLYFVIFGVFFLN